MTKRITLNKLINYVIKITKENNQLKLTENNIYSIKTGDIKYIDKFKFNNLVLNEEKNVGDLPKNLKKIFNPFIKDTYRIGIVNNIIDNYDNTSLFYSFLLCIIDNFSNFSLEKQKDYVITLRDKLILDIERENLFSKFEYNKLKLQKKELLESIKNFKNNRITLVLLSDYFNINIFLLNILEDKLYVIYSEDKFNIFKINIFLVFYNDFFSPLKYNNEYLLNYNNTLLKKIVNVDKLQIYTLHINTNNEKKIFEVDMEDLNKYCNNNVDNNYDEVFVDEVAGELYIDDPGETEVDIESIKNEEDIFFTQKDIKNIKKIKIKKELNKKMKLSELQDMAKKNKISIYDGVTKNGKNKNKTKNKLYKELKELIDN